MHFRNARVGLLALVLAACGQSATQSSAADVGSVVLSLEDFFQQLTSPKAVAQAKTNLALTEKMSFPEFYDSALSGLNNAPYTIGGYTFHNLRDDMVAERDFLHYLGTKYSTVGDAWKDDLTPGATTQFRSVAEIETFVKALHTILAQPANSASLDLLGTTTTKRWKTYCAQTYTQFGRCYRGVCSPGYTRCSSWHTDTWYDTTYTNDNGGNGNNNSGNSGSGNSDSGSGVPASPGNCQNNGGKGYGDAWTQNGKTLRKDDGKTYAVSSACISH